MLRRLRSRGWFMLHHLKSRVWPQLRPWVIVALAIIVWSWALSTPDLVSGLAALILTIVIVAHPLRERIWPTLGPLLLPGLGLLGSLLCYLAWVRALQEIHAIQHTPGSEETYVRGILSIDTWSGTTYLLLPAS
jgi:hypothetical protein